MKLKKQMVHQNTVFITGTNLTNAKLKLLNERGLWEEAEYTKILSDTKWSLMKVMVCEKLAFMSDFVKKYAGKK